MEISTKVAKPQGKGHKGCFLNFRFFKKCVPIKSRQGGSINGNGTQDDDTTGDEHLDFPSNTAPPTPTINFQINLSPKLHLHRFTYEELSCATKKFRPDNFVGQGGFGTVYKGLLIENSSRKRISVAVKALNLYGFQGHREWLAEVNFLGNLQHPNVVKLIGYCIEEEQRLLVYEYMPRGNLANHLFRRSTPLSWSLRLKAVLDAAKGLAYLHEEAEKQVIYRDFKTANILLDTDFRAKLSDFGLARDGPVQGKSHVSTRILGTHGYAAPEYLMTGHLTTKSDVYSFGVALLEILSGRKCIDRGRKGAERYLLDWARPILNEPKFFCTLIDPKLDGHFSSNAAFKAVVLASLCVSPNPKDRPLMSAIVKAMETMLDYDDVAENSPNYRQLFGESSSSRVRGEMHASPCQRNSRGTSRHVARQGRGRDLG